jgi:uncharacterized protein (TIGR02611 family)
MDESTPEGASRAQQLREQLARRRAEHRERSRVFRIGFAFAGATVTLTGLVLLVTPGPAFVIIPIGLAMLALEFAWAERLLDLALKQAENARRKAAATTRTQRIVGVVAWALAIAAALAAWLAWDIPLIPG